MKVPIYSMKGKASKSSATLPQAFEEPVRLDLIRRAVRAARANRRQAYGASPRAGYRHSVSWPGKGRGMAVHHVRTEVVDVVQRLRILLEVDELIHPRSKRNGTRR